MFKSKLPQLLSHGNLTHTSELILSVMHLPMHVEFTYPCELTYPFEINKRVYMFTTCMFDTLALGHLEKAAYIIIGFSSTEGCPGFIVWMNKARAWIPDD